MQNKRSTLNWYTVIVHKFGIKIKARPQIYASQGQKLYNHVIDLSLKQSLTHYRLENLHANVLKS